MSKPWSHLSADGPLPGSGTGMRARFAEAGSRPWTSPSNTDQPVLVRRRRDGLHCVGGLRRASTVGADIHAASSALGLAIWFVGSYLVSLGTIFGWYAYSPLTLAPYAPGRGLHGWLRLIIWLVLTGVWALASVRVLRPASENAASELPRSARRQRSACGRQEHRTAARRARHGLPPSSRTRTSNMRQERHWSAGRQGSRTPQCSCLAADLQAVIATSLTAAPQRGTRRTPA